MSTTTTHSNDLAQGASKSPSTILHRVRELLPAIASASTAIDTERRLPDALFERLLQAGCYRMLVPHEYGGAALSLPEFLEVIELLGTVDGSVAWSVSQAGLAQVIASPLDARVLAELYRQGPDVVVAGVLAPKGRAGQLADGFRVNGRWAFATGCDRASWFYLQSMLTDGRRIQLEDDGTPRVRVMFMPRSDIEVHDTWESLGLRGTASHDVRVPGRVCPLERSFALGAPPSVHSPVYDVPLMDQGGFYVGAVTLGIARGALDEIRQLVTGGRRPTFSRTLLSESHVFQERLGVAHMQLQAASALLYGQARKACTGAVVPPSLQQRATVRATCREVTRLCSQAVDTAYEAGGSSSVYDKSPLQRRLRDIRVAAQHVWNSPEHTRFLGGSLVGAEDSSGLGAI